MKFVKSILFLCLPIILFFSCADYDLLDESLHPRGVTLSIRGVSDSSVTLSWTRYTGEDFKNYKVYFSRSDIIDTTDSVSDTISFAIDTNKIIRGLTTGTQYYFRVLVSTKLGGIAVSNIVDTTTIMSLKGTIVFYQPDSSDITDSSVVLRWTHCVSAFDAYKIYMDTTSNVDNKDSLVQTSISDTVRTIRSLEQDRDYWFRVYAVFDTGIVGKSKNGLNVRTKINPQSDSIKLSVVWVTDTTAMLRWTKYAGNDFKSYKIYYSINASADDQDSLADTKNIQSDTVTIIPALRPGTDYAFLVMVTRMRRNILPSNNLQVTTTNTQKGKIRLFGPEAVTDSTVGLRWSNCNVEFDSYRIFRGNTQSVDTLDSIAISQYNLTNAVIKNLTKNTVYWFRVFARKGNEYVASSNPIEVLTGSR